MMHADIRRSDWFQRSFPRFDWRAGLILSLVLIASGAFAIVPPFAQPQAFHDFADQRGWLGIPNFMDVVSNVPFTIAALAGLLVLVRRTRRERRLMHVDGPRLMRVDRVCLLALFLGIGLTSVGSAFYHLAPGNERLVWDRLPMLLTFVSLLATLIAERISARSAAWLLAPFLLTAAASVFYWRSTELAGAGDLRAYFLVEGATLVSVLLIVALYRGRYLPTRLLMVGLACYALAVVFEQLDRVVWSLWSGLSAPLVSGHTIKHLFAAAGAFAMAWAVRGRSPVQRTGPVGNA